MNNRNNGAPQFIKIGDVRIKLDNIKNYGIKKDQACVYILKSNKSSLSIKREIRQNHSYYIYNWDPKKLRRFNPRDNEDYEFAMQVLKGPYHLNWCYSYNDSFYDKDGTSVSVDDVVAGEMDYLYITTFQGDNFQFWADEINVNEKMNELDKWLT